MIELLDIHKCFGRVKALQGVSLVIRPGTVHGVIGENGAGKSTLMRILTGYARKDSGFIRMDGHDLDLRSPRQASTMGIGMLYQEPLDFPQLRVLENFAAGSRVAWKKSRQELATLAARFGFSLEPDQLVEKMTVGERQQLELLRLIRHSIRVLILDEPTTGISESQQELLFNALRELREKGTAIVLVSHKLEEIDRLCDEVTVLRQGKSRGHQLRPFAREELLHLMFQEFPDKSTPPAVQSGTEAVLEFDRVSSTAGRSGLDPLTLTIRSGEIVGLAGLDGSGQQLFLRLGAGLLHPNGGEIRNRGGRSFFLPADRLEEGLIGGMSVREHHLLASTTPFFLRPGCGLDQARWAIERFSLVGVPETLAESLSGGNQQRLLLSLIPPGVQLLFIENPTRGLDLRSASWTWQQLHQLAATGGTLCFTSPDLDEILDNASRILVFFNGKMVLDVPRDQADGHFLSRAITGEAATLAAC